MERPATVGVRVNSNVPYGEGVKQQSEIMQVGNQFIY